MSYSDYEHGIQRDVGHNRPPPVHAESEAKPAAEPPPLPVRSNALFGETVREAAPFPVTGTLFALLAAAGAVLTYQHIGWLLGGASVCASIAAVFFWGMRRGVTYQFTELGIEFRAGGKHLSLPYAEILEIFVPHKYAVRTRFPMYLLTADGYEILPAKLSIPSETIYQFLITQPHGDPPAEDLDNEFGTFLRHQRALYRPKDVCVYHARTKKSWAAHWNGGMLFGMGLVLAGVVYFVISAVRRAVNESYLPYFPLGFVGVGLGLFIFLLGILARRPGANHFVKNWKKSMLIASPGGLALSLGDIRGEMRWPELVGLVWKNGRMMKLRLKGVDIQVWDIFHWPLEHIANVCGEYYEASKGR